VKSSEFTAPYSSAQNGLSEHAIRTMMDDVRTLLRDSDLSHSYWAEAAAFSVDTRNLVPSRRHPGKVPMESFTGKRQSVSHLRVFGSRCWAKVPTINGALVTGGLKLDSRGVECRLLGYASGGGNYKVQDITSRRVFVSCDVIFEEGNPHRILPTVGENTLLFNTLDIVHDEITPSNNSPASATPSEHRELLTTDDSTSIRTPSTSGRDTTSFTHTCTVPSVTPPTLPTCRSTRVPQPSTAVIESRDYQQQEDVSCREGQDWANEHLRPQASLVFDCLHVELDDYIACLAETKASHNIPRSYRHVVPTRELHG